MSQEITVDFLGQEIQVTLDAGALSIFNTENADAVILAAQEAEAAAAAATIAAQNAEAAAAEAVNKLDRDGANFQPTFLDNIQLTQTATLAAPVPLQAKFKEILSVEDFAPVGRDDVDVLAAALDAAANDGLPVRMFNSRVIDAPLTIPAGVTLLGPKDNFDQPIGAVAYLQPQGVLSIASGVSVTMGQEAKIKGLRAIRNGMTTPTTNAEAMAAIAAMAGTAFIGDTVGIEMSDMQIIGFNRAIDISGVGRVRISNIKGDCTNGIRLVESLDVSMVTGCHFWPFLTAGAGVPSLEQLGLVRAGIAYDIGGAQNDYTSVLNCFSFGYAIGYQANGGAHISFTGNGADYNANLQIGTLAEKAVADAAIGLNIQGATRNTLVTDFRGSGQGRTVVVQPSGRSPVVTLRDLRSWAPGLAHVDHVAGQMVLDTGGLETAEDAPFPDGHKINIGDGITSANIRLRGPNPPTLVGSELTLRTKVTRANNTASFTNNIGARATTDVAFERNGKSYDHDFGGGDFGYFSHVDGAAASGSHFQREAVFAKAGDAVAGSANQNVEMTAAICQETNSPAPYLKTASFSRIDQYDPSSYPGELGYAGPSIIYRDAVATENYAIIKTGNMRGSIWAGHFYAEAEAGSDGIVRGTETEVYNYTGNTQVLFDTSTTKIGSFMVAIGGNVTAAHHLGARDSGIWENGYHAGFDAVNTHFFRVADVFTVKKIGAEVTLSLGSIAPPASSNLALYMERDNEVFSQMVTLGTSTGLMAHKFLKTGVRAFTAGLNCATNDYVITASENLTDAPILDLQPDRLGMFSAPAVSGGSNLLFIKQGTAPSAVAGGGAIYFEAGACKAMLPNGTIVTLG